MSVLRHGGSYLQRRLTKMYTDTKTSCESVTTASKAVDDPELVALHRSYRTQRDRLLAWGLDWSDASAAQPNDIDESLTEAGFSEVVASVMSSIQELLNEAERLQHVGTVSSAGSGSGSDAAPAKMSKDALADQSPKAQWTDEDIRRSKTVLSNLTACIDTLYDLSKSRRDMSASMSSAGQAGLGSKTRSKPLHNSPVEPRASFPSPTKHEPSETSAFTNLHVVPPTALYEAFQGEQRPGKSPSPFGHLCIDRSALQLSGTSHDNSPPPYEVVAATANSRAIGRMRTSASPLLASTPEPYVTVVIEFAPMMRKSQDPVTALANRRMARIQRSLDQLVQNARVSHLGLLRFLGYYADMPNSRYGFIYEMPVDYFPFLRNPTDLLRELKPKPLVSLFQAGDAQIDAPLPSLETRFRLAYDLLMAALHLRSQNIVHGNINSSNILVFPGLSDARGNEVALTENLRRPYLTSLAQCTDDTQLAEPLSSTMYRHPDDKRNIDDECAWAYDLYSLGLVLLEIGLWTPISRLWKMKYNNTMFKQRIENVYLKKLAPKCGTAYLHMVQLCLDAPNFHLSTQPLADLGLRVPQTYHYPVLDLSEPDGIFAFSMNFLYTICKIAWSCTRIDIFAAPPAEELDDSLPLALVPLPDPKTEKEPINGYQDDFRHADVPLEESATTLFDESKMPAEIRATADRGSIRKRTVKKLPHVDIPQEHLDEWNGRLMPRLSKLLQKILKDSPEACGASLMMTGETVDNAKTTICVTCSSVKKVRSALKKHFKVDGEGWDLIVVRGDLQRSKVSRKKHRRPAKLDSRVSPEAVSRPNLNPCYQQRPVCGASIGAFVNEEHLPPVSYGGAILVDGVPYGMTVHHMLEAPSDDEGSDGGHVNFAGRSAGKPPRQAGTSHADLSLSWCDEAPDIDYEFWVTDTEDDAEDALPTSRGMSGSFEDYLLSDIESSEDEGSDEDDAFDEDEDAASIGDTAGIEPGEEPRLLVTQPAIDDVHDDFFPSPEDRDDEHLASHSLGYVYASSGVRRWRHKGIKHEIDWALVKIDDSRLDTRNIVLDSGRSRETHHAPRGTRTERGDPGRGQPIHLTKVAELEDLGGLEVHCCGRTSGLQRGQISKAMTIVKLQGRQSFSESFCVNGNFGVPGDSGAWVFDKSTGQVCGHVLAWSEKTHMTYITPMEVLFKDIARRLHAACVTLPDSSAESAASVTVPRPPLMDPSYHDRSRGFSGHMQLPVDISRLTLGLDDHASLSRVGGSRSLHDAASSTRYSRPMRPHLVAPSRGLERQLA